MAHRWNLKLQRKSERWAPARAPRLEAPALLDELRERDVLQFSAEEEAILTAFIASEPSPELNNPAYTANHILPGSGEPLETCGTHKFNLRTAEGCGSRPIFHNCGRQACPECWPRWAKRAGRRAAASVHGKLQAWAEYGHGSYGKPRGWILSPPQDWASRLVLEGRAEEVRKAAAAAARVMGLRASASVFHALRQVGGTRGGSTIDAPPVGEWLHFQGKAWRLAPHFHVLAVGYWNRPPDPADLPPELAGWVIHLPKGSENIAALADLENWFIYLLSHADVHPVKPKNAVRYYGGFHSSKVRLEDSTVEKEPATCECGECGGLELYLFPTDARGEEDYCSCAEPAGEWAGPGFSEGRVAFDALPDRPAVSDRREACLQCMKPLLQNLEQLAQAWVITEKRRYIVTAAGRRDGSHRPPQRFLS